MNSLIRKSATPFGLLIVSISIIVFALVISVSAVTHATNGDSARSGRLVTIYDRGIKKVIISHASTVGDAIKEANITIDSKDSIEPSITTELISSDYQINIYRARPVLIIDGNTRTKVMTPYQTPIQIAQSANIELYDEDVTKIDRSSDIVTDGVGLRLIIKRATPIQFTLYGNAMEIRTQASTVGEMLTEKNIIIGVDDRTSLSLETAIAANMNVRLWREGKQTITAIEDVNYDTETIEDANQQVGYKSIKAVGIKGSRNVTYQIIIQDDKEISRSEIASLITLQPTKQIEIIGVKGKYTTPSENETITWNYLIEHGYSRVQTAGIMGNLMQEHHFNTTGDGLAQWNGSRKAALYSRDYPNNIYTQLDFLLEELNGNYSSVRDAIKSDTSTDDPKNIVIIFQNKFEKCNPYYCMQDQRINFARNILASH